MTPLPPITISPRPNAWDSWATYHDTAGVILYPQSMYSPLMARFCLAHELSHAARWTSSYVLDYTTNLRFRNHEESVCNAVALAVTGTLPPAMLPHMSYYAPIDRAQHLTDTHTTLLELRARGWDTFIRSWEVPCPHGRRSKMPVPTLSSFDSAFEQVRSHMLTGAFVI